LEPKPEGEFERWIFCFRQSGSRELEASEMAELRESAKHNWLKVAFHGAASVVSACVGLVGIAVVAGSESWGYFAIGFGLMGFIFFLSVASRAEGLARIFRRVSRVGRVDVFHRTALHPEMPEAWQDREFPPLYCEGPYWEAEEDFLDSVEGMAGQAPLTLESPSEEDVLFRIDGRLVSKKFEIPKFTLRRMDVVDS